jgi:hypothetical protein
MPVKELQRAVISRALEVYEDGAKKKHLKQVFKQQVRLGAVRLWPEYSDSRSRDAYLGLLLTSYGDVDDDA